MNIDLPNTSTTRIYRAYINMMDRCYNPNHRAFHNYGGRGVAVCEEWRQSYRAFYDWAYANGYDPSLSGLENSLDRIDVDGDYCPENCRWIPMSEQQANRRETIRLTFNGETHTLIEWEKITGIDNQTLYLRAVKRHWPAERLLTEPPRTTTQGREYCLSDGTALSLTKIAALSGVNKDTAWRRLNRLGWSVEECIAGKHEATGVKA